MGTEGHALSGDGDVLDRDYYGLPHGQVEGHSGQNPWKVGGTVVAGNASYDIPD